MSDYNDSQLGVTIFDFIYYKHLAILEQNMRPEYLIAILYDAWRLRVVNYGHSSQEMQIYSIITYVYK